MSRNDFYKAHGSEKVFKITLDAGAAFTADASNYHTFTVRVVRGTQTRGETIGTPYSLAARSLGANTEVILYDDATGLAMSDGDRLVLNIDETGSPTALERVSLWIDRQRITR